MSDFAGLEARIGYSFRQRELFVRALTHRSAASDHLERLEFLGDAVLGLIISEHLYHHFATAGEGQLTRLRSLLVCRDTLLDIAHAWQLQRHVRVGGGERDAAGRVKSPAILADAVEALIAAVFLDGGWDAVRRLVLAAWGERLAAIDAGADVRDAKTRLQEFTQARGWGLPHYDVEDLGGGLEARFLARCLVHGRTWGKGRGKTKKAAEAAAARQAWQALTHGKAP